jgi:hypothetical protein
VTTISHLKKSEYLTTRTGCWLGASQYFVDRMIERLQKERSQVRAIMKDEVEALMRMGADVAKMTYKCKNANTRRACITAKNMRESYVGGTFNIKCIHWIFYELPYGTHRDVLTQCKSHMDEVLDKVEQAMSITSWAPRRAGETNSHKNCLQLAYAKVLNDKRQTIIKENGASHKRRPLVKHPRTAAIRVPLLETIVQHLCLDVGITVSLLT